MGALPHVAFEIDFFHSASFLGDPSKWLDASLVCSFLLLGVIVRSCPRCLPHPVTEGGLHRSQLGAVMNKAATDTCLRAFVGTSVVTSQGGDPFVAGLWVVAYLCY